MTAKGVIKLHFFWLPKISKKWTKIQYKHYNHKNIFLHSSHCENQTIILELTFLIFYEILQCFIIIINYLSVNIFFLIHAHLMN